MIYNGFSSHTSIKYSTVISFLLVIVTSSGPQPGFFKQCGSVPSIKVLKAAAKPRSQTWRTRSGISCEPRGFEIFGCFEDPCVHLVFRLKFSI